MSSAVSASGSWPPTPANLPCWTSAPSRSHPATMPRWIAPARTMNDLRRPLERLQPALLDRLTDQRPHEKVEARRERVISEQQLREAVRRDLTWLFSTT